MIRDSVRLMSALERDFYRDCLDGAKAALGLPVGARSVEAANAALAYTFRNRRIRREKGIVIEAVVATQAGLFG